MQGDNHCTIQSSGKLIDDSSESEYIVTGTIFSFRSVHSNVFRVLSFVTKLHYPRFWAHQSPYRYLRPL